MSVQAPVPKDHPMLQAWERYKASERYANAKRWANESEQYIEGSLWGAFLDGWQAAHDLTGDDPLPAPSSEDGSERDQQDLRLAAKMLEMYGDRDDSSAARQVAARLRARLSPSAPPSTEEVSEENDADAR